MGSYTKRKKFDALVSRILFFELGTLFCVVSILVSLNNPLTEIQTILFGTGFLVAGTFCMFCCFTIDDRKVIKWAEKTGNHWLLFFLVIIAYGSASVIRGNK